MSAVNARAHKHHNAFKAFSYSHGQNAALENVFKDTLLNMRGGPAREGRREVQKHSKKSKQLWKDKEIGKNKPEDGPERGDTKGGITREEFLNNFQTDFSLEPDTVHVCVCVLKPSVIFHF